MINGVLNRIYKTIWDKLLYFKFLAFYGGDLLLNILITHLVIIIAIVLIIFLIKKILEDITYQIAAINSLSSIGKLIFGKQCFITKEVNSIIRKQRKKMKLQIIEVDDKTKRAEIENAYVIETVDKIKEAYREGHYTFSEMGYRLSLLNSDVNYIMCIFTGILASMLLEFAGSYYQKVIEFQNTLIVNIILFVVLFFIITLFIFCLRRVVVVSLSIDPVFDEAEKCIIREILNKYNITS